MEPLWGPAFPQDLLPGPEAAIRTAGLHEAQQLLTEAQRLLADVLEHAQTKGRYYAKLIDEASHILTDGKWANFKDWVDRNADWIERYTDNLGWVGTACAIGAIFLPGANILVLTAMGITGVSAATHATLLATGNGSWGDMALDVLALATLGAGAAATKGLKGAQLAARTAAAAEAREKAIVAAYRELANEADIATKALSRASNEAAVQAAKATLRDIDMRALESGVRAADEVMRTPVAAAAGWEAFLVGEPGNARAYNDLMRTAAQYSGAAGMTEAVTAGTVAYGAAQTSYLTGTGADFYGKRDGIGVLSKGLFRIVEGSSWVVKGEAAPA